MSAELKDLATRLRNYSFPEGATIIDDLADTLAKTGLIPRKLSMIEQFEMSDNQGGKAAKIAQGIKQGAFLTPEVLNLLQRHGEKSVRSFGRRAGYDIEKRSNESP